MPASGAEWQKCYSALLVALEDRFGKNRVWQRTNKYFEPEDVADDVAVAVLQGLRGRGLDYLAAYRKLGIPVLVVDLGWMRRERGYWQVSPNGLNTVPLRAPDGRRFDELQLKVFPAVQRNYHTVIAGQLPGDAQHDLATDADMLRWARNSAARVKELFPKRRVFWRPHPLFMHSLGKPTIMSSPERPIQEFMKDEHVGSAIVYNSTLGLDLLRNGAHVIAHGPRTVYTDLVSSDIGNLENAHPGPERVRELLERLAYGQYQVDELADWANLAKLLELHSITGDW